MVKNEDEEDQSLLISKWKALESIASMKGGSLQFFVPSGSHKFASAIAKENGISAKIIKLNSK